MYIYLRTKIASFNIFTVFPCLLVFIVMTGCQSGPSRTPPASNMDRLIQTYPQLREGRFIVIADFEDPKHMELFQLISTSGRASLTHDPRKGKRNTGHACARFTTYAEGDTVVMNNDRASQWYMVRDWRAYDLLLMSIHSPKDNTTLTINIEAGNPNQYPPAQTTIPLDRGWNNLRLDLADAAARIPIDDVREITLSVHSTNQKTELLIDDIILTSNRKDLFGDSTNTTGDLYVQQTGRRWNIGAGGRFELSFANGQIVGCYNLRSDPYRLHNLVATTMLGPEPVILDSQNRQSRKFSALGKVVSSHPKIFEMNSVRTVVMSDWRFTDRYGDSLSNRPYQRWIYTIYPTGQIYVAIETTAHTNSFNPKKLALSVSASHSQKNPIETFVRRPSGEGAQRDSIYAWLRNESADMAMLFVPMQMDDIIEQTDTKRESVSFIAIDKKNNSETKHWISQLYVTSSSALSDEQANARATTYQHPPMPELEFGTFISSDTMNDSEFTATGFDPVSGCYYIKPEKNMVRFFLNHTDDWFTPAFKIHDPKDRKVSVYINHLLYKKTARDRDGNLIFQLQSPIYKRTLVEVLFQPL